MSFKIGDFVRFVDEAGEGTITSFHDNGLVGVTDADGFEIPIPASKITLVYGQRNRAEDDKKAPSVPGNFVSEGIYLAITGDIRHGIATFYVVNDTSYQVFFSLASEKEELLKGEFAGQINPQSFQQVYVANVTSIGSWPVFHLQIVFFTQQLQPLKLPLLISKRIRAADLSSAKQQVTQLKQKAWLFKLDDYIQVHEDSIEKLRGHFISHRPVLKHK